MTDGYVYCFSNVSMPGILKVGMTMRTPDLRLCEANSSSTWKPPTPYKIEFAKKVSNPKQTEINLHNILSKYTKRIHPKREFFQASIEDIKQFFDLIDNELCVEPQLTKQEEEAINKIIDQLVEEEIIQQFRINYCCFDLFIGDCIIKTDNNRTLLRKRCLYEAFKYWFVKRFPCEKLPRMKDLHNCMEKKFGPYSSGWDCITIISSEEDAVDEDMLDYL